MALDKRVIAIQMLPKAYSEIQRLKGELTWTRFIIECVQAKVGDNAILQDELAGLIAEAEARKDKPKAEKKAKVEKPAEPKIEPTEPKIEPTKPETKVTAKDKGSSGISTPEMRQHSKGKTLKELQAGKDTKGHELTKAELRKIEELAPIK